MLKTILGFLKLPQTWTGLAAFAVAFGIAGPAVDFISAEAGNLAMFFGLFAQLIGFGAAQRLSSVVNDYTQRLELALYKSNLPESSVESIMQEVETP